MTRQIPQADSGQPVNPAHLLVLFDPASDDPIAQEVQDVIRSVFTQAIENKVDGIEAGAQINRTAAQLKTAYESNADTNALTDALLAQIQSVADPKRLVGLLQWDVNPKIIAGSDPEDFARAFRATFEQPYLPLTDYYVEMFIGGVSVRNRAQWVTAAQLDVVVSQAQSEAISALVGPDKHAEVELRFFTAAVGGNAVAVTSRPILIVEADSDGSPGDGVTEDRARQIALAATAAQAHAGDASRWPRNKLTIPDATEGESGLVEKATDDEMSAGTVDKFPDAFEVKAYVDGSHTQMRQIGLLKFVPEPAVVPYRTVDELSAGIRTIELKPLNAELLTGDIWVEGWIQGQRGLNRTKWSNAINLTITITESWADSAAQNLAGDSDARAEVRLRFYSSAVGGNEIERVGLNIPLVDQRPRENVLQAPVNGADGAGITQTLLAADYADWRYLSGACWEGKDNDIVEFRFHTAMLAAQTAAKELLISRGASGAVPVRLQWTPATRGIAIQGGGATTDEADRIIYLVLED